MILEPNRHAPVWPQVGMPRDGLDIRRAKALAEDAREEAFLAEQTIHEPRVAKTHCRNAGSLIGQILSDLADIMGRPA